MKQKILHNLKKSNKKILCCFLSVSMALNTVGICGGTLQAGAPVSVQAAEADENGFEIEDTVLINYVGEGGNVVIPDGVTEIWEHAFEYCDGLRSIEIPDSVVSIGDFAFTNCDGLRSIEIPDGVTKIGGNAFSNCDGLINIEIPDSVVSIGYAAFYNCDGLRSIEIPDGVTEIGGNAFYNCDGLIRAEIPESVTSIGAGIFSDCSGMEEILVDESNQNYISEDGVLFDKEKSELLCYPAGKQMETYKIPASVTEIGEDAFCGCERLTSVEIPASVTEIRNSAFRNCSGLTSIEIPASVTEIRNSAFGGCERLTSIEIPECTTEIEDCAFWGCHGLTKIELPESVISIGAGAFSNSSNMIEILVDERNQNYISEKGVLFNKEKSELLCYPAGKQTETYKIPASVTEIGEDAFCGCERLTSIEIPNSVTTIGDGAFEYCDGLTGIEIPNSVTEIRDSAFFDCDGLTSIEIPNSVTTIGDSAFWSCDGLTSIEIPNSVTTIGKSAFEYCDGLTSIEISNNVERIEYGTFFGCSSLKAAAIPDSVIGGFENIFLGTSPDFTIYCHENSAAHSYAEKYGYRYEIVDADTDVGEAMRKALKGNKETAKGRLTLKKKKINLKKGQKSKIKITSPLNTGVTYRSLNTSIATVNKNGIVTGKKKGKTSIVVSANGVKKKVKVTVKTKLKDEMIVALNKKMELSKSEITMKKGTKLTIQKTSGMGKVTFRSLNKKIASVSVKGLVKAKKRGKTAILIKNKQKTVKLKVTVKR